MQPATATARAASSPATVSGNRTPVFPDSITFDVQYGGIGAEGVDLVWRGRVAGELPGEVTVRMEYAGLPADREMPIWPVNAWLFFSADDYRSSFAAELSGSMNWHTGEMRVTGVSDGGRVGASIEQRMWLRRPGYEAPPQCDSSRGSTRFTANRLTTDSRIPRCRGDCAGSASGAAVLRALPLSP